ncbi:predicted protein [Histoplasma capsulatum G186AR]|uniref:Uncharacterized protein n=1 Tax=Ajellomyces capsulatus (strain G186AR / H82 / ATCC MYA-2454 / RMSCC 2432) TaxID=447093 RepID=C0NYW5_AJECG|nr:uncharacterized protein HCBG_08345 [Histoplasma capsulatum G186AR]EEH03405.1 predicted protein [Histoplasma capsulatum G186AR]
MPEERRWLSCDSYIQQEIAGAANGCCVGAQTGKEKKKQTTKTGRDWIGILGLGGGVVAVRVPKITAAGQSERGAGRLLTQQYVTAVFGGLVHAAAWLSQDTV